MLSLPANVRAALWMLGAVFGFISMALAGRQLSALHDTFEIMLWRSVVGILTVLIAARIAGTWHKIRVRNMGLHLVRNLSHFTGQNLWFAALAMIPLAQLFAMEFSYPLWVALAAPLPKRRTASTSAPLAGTLPAQFLATIDSTRWHRLP